MRVAAVYSFNKGKEVVTKKYPKLLVEVNEVIQAWMPYSTKTKRA